LGIGVMPLTFRKRKKKLEDISIVCEFRDVFPKELPGQPPQIEMDFEINLVPSAQHISKTPNHIATT